MSALISWLRRLDNKLQSTRVDYPPGPQGLTLYCVGDVHGRVDCLEEAQRAIDSDRARRGDRRRSVEIYLGDYVDRGPDPAGVLDRLAARVLDRDLVCLKGNHEDFFLRFLDGDVDFASWSAAGGNTTVMSYGLDPRDALDDETAFRERLRRRVPTAHDAFLRALAPKIRIGAYLFVHAGIRPGVPLERQREEDLLWIRDDFLASDVDHGLIVVHGHSPVTTPDLRHNRINLDTGAYATGRLSCLRVDAAGAALLDV